MTDDDETDSTLLMLACIFGTLGLFVVVVFLANYFSPARGPPPKKKLGAKQKKRQVLRQGLQMPTD
jgi:hypothetical protein